MFIAEKNGFLPETQDCFYDVKFMVDTSGCSCWVHSGEGPASLSHNQGRVHRGKVQVWGNLSHGWGSQASPGRFFRSATRDEV